MAIIASNLLYNTLLKFKYMLVQYTYVHIRKLK